MRAAIRISVLAGTVAIAALSTNAAAVELPKRKPGHWEITTVSQDTGMQTINACIGTDDNIAALGGNAECSEPKVTPAGSEVIVDVVCKTAAGKQTMSAAYGGDFSTRYHAVMKMSFDPPPQNATRTLGVTIDGRYIGPDCPQGAGK